MRRLRYTGSLAVMISALVAGSAWMMPPVVGRLLWPNEARNDELPLPMPLLLLPELLP